jgi:hypothetical protein
MAREGRRPSDQPQDAQRVQDRMIVHEMAVGMTAGRIAELRKRLTHLSPTDRAAAEELSSARKEGGELSADTDWYVAMRGLFSPELIDVVWERMLDARTERKRKHAPTPPSEH